MTAAETTVSHEEFIVPDAVAERVQQYSDPRLDQVSFIQLKRYLETEGTLARNDKLQKLKHCAKKQMLLRLASEENVPLAGLFEEVTEAHQPPPKPSPFERAFERAMTVTDQDKANWRQFGFISLDFTESELKAVGGVPTLNNPGANTSTGSSGDQVPDLAVQNDQGSSE